METLAPHSGGRSEAGTHACYLACLVRAAVERATVRENVLEMDWCKIHAPQRVSSVWASRQACATLSLLKPSPTSTSFCNQLFLPALICVNKSPSHSRVGFCSVVLINVLVCEKSPVCPFNVTRTFCATGSSFMDTSMWLWNTIWIALRLFRVTVMCGKFVYLICFFFCKLPNFAH